MPKPQLHQKILTVTIKMLKMCQNFNFVSKKLSTVWDQIKPYGYWIVKNQGPEVKSHKKDVQSSWTLLLQDSSQDLLHSAFWNYQQLFHSIMLNCFLIVRPSVVQDPFLNYKSWRSCKVSLVAASPANCCTTWTEWAEVLSCLLPFVMHYITDILIHVNRHGDH